MNIYCAIAMSFVINKYKTRKRERRKIDRRKIKSKSDMNINKRRTVPQSIYCCKCLHNGIIDKWIMVCTKIKQNKQTLQYWLYIGIHSLEEKQSRVTEQTVMNREPKHNQPHNNISMFTLALALTTENTNTYKHNLWSW